MIEVAKLSRVMGYFTANGITDVNVEVENNIGGENTLVFKGSNTASTLNFVIRLRPDGTVGLNKTDLYDNAPANTVVDVSGLPNVSVTSRTTL